MEQRDLEDLSIGDYVLLHRDDPSSYDNGVMGYLKEIGPDGIILSNRETREADGTIRKQPLPDEHYMAEKLADWDGLARLASYEELSDARR